MKPPRRVIVTICNPEYGPLLENWVEAVTGIADVPVFVLCIDGFAPTSVDGVNIISANPKGNPFPSDLPDHACVEKLRVFQHLPESVSEILFLDLDVLVLEPFWEETHYFDLSRRKLVMCPDLFVGYKEQLVSEFEGYDPSFRMKYNDDGSFFYFNTGAFFASREAHSRLFANFLDVWVDYVKKMKRYPSIYDQNLFNYCLIKFKVDVQSMPVENNCLRQYEIQTIDATGCRLNGRPIAGYHFNGGDVRVKLERWLSLREKLEAAKDAT